MGPKARPDRPWLVPKYCQYCAKKYKVCGGCYDLGPEKRSPNNIYFECDHCYQPCSTCSATCLKTKLADNRCTKCVLAESTSEQHKRFLADEKLHHAEQDFLALGTWEFTKWVQAQFRHVKFATNNANDIAKRVKEMDVFILKTKETQLNHEACLYKYRFGDKKDTINFNRKDNCLKFCRFCIAWLQKQHVYTKDDK